MQELKSVLNQSQYSNSKLKNNINNSNSTVAPTQVLRNLTDLIANEDYLPWYVMMLNKLGYNRFMDLANKARASSDTPHLLFRWMLKNNEIVK